jgi:hypothetical protein
MITLMLMAGAMVNYVAVDHMMAHEVGRQNASTYGDWQK